MYKVGYNEHIVNLQGITVSHEDCQFFLVLEYCSKGEMNYFQKKLWNQFIILFSYHSGSLYDYMLANKVKISYALANYELSPPNSEEVERFNQLISWSYQVSIFRLVEGLCIGELRKTVILIIWFYIHNIIL